MRVVADTDFLSAFLKIKQVDIIFKTLEIDKIYVTRAVFDELAKAPFFYELKELMERIELVVSEKLPETQTTATLGKGEIESISYALETNSVLLTNDKKAGQFASKSGINVLDIISFLFLCKETNILQRQDLENILDLLKKHDYMEFNKEQKRLLLE